MKITPTEVEELIERRTEAGFDGPLEHYQGTNTSARYENLISWNDWRDTEGGDYSDTLRELYDALGIFEGNGEWYQSAWAYDKTIPDKRKTAWGEFVQAELLKIDPSDYWEWDEEAEE